MAQSKDGFLWLGTGGGLYRFDGVTFEKFRPAEGEEMPANNVNSLLVSRNGDIWIGFASGAVSRLRAGHIANFNTGLPPVPVLELAEDRAGGIWAAFGEGRRGGLAHYSHGRWEVIGPERGMPSGRVTSVLCALDGSIWVAAEDALEVLRPGAVHFVHVKAAASDFPRLKQSPDGGIWLTTGDRPGLQRLLDGPPGGREPAPSYARPPPTDNPRAESILFDRHGALWGTYGSGGVFRMQGVGSGTAKAWDQVVGEKFGMERGLTSNLANPILEDREGNVWVGTNLGLDQFRETSVVVAPGLPRESRHAYRIARGEAGAMYVASTDALFRARPDQAATKLRQLRKRRCSYTQTHSRGHG